MLDGVPLSRGRGGEWKGSFLIKDASFAGAGPAEAPALIVLLAWLFLGSVPPVAVQENRIRVGENIVRSAGKGFDTKEKV